MRRFAALFGLAAMALAGCDDDSKTAVDPNAGKPVTFAIAVDASLFAADATIAVEIYDEDQIGILEDNSRCEVSLNEVTREESIRCPNDVTYVDPRPEVFSFAAAGLTGNIEVKSATVKTKESFQISISGKSADGCNTTSASRSGVAEYPKVTLGSLEWSTTLMACI